MHDVLYKFAVLGFPTTPEVSCARRAVLHTCHRDLWNTPGSLYYASCTGAFDALLRTWRARVPQITAKLPAEHAWQRRALALQNCIPSGVYVRPAHLRYCNVRSFCPWCWGREATEIFISLRRRCFVATTAATKTVKPGWGDVPLGAPRSKPRLTYEPRATLNDLIVRRVQHPLLLAPFTCRDVPGSVLREIYRSRVRGDSRLQGNPFGRPVDFKLARQFGMTGGYETISTRYRTENGKPVGWSLRYLQVFEVAPTWAPTQACSDWLSSEKLGASFQRFHGFSQRKLVNLVVSIHTYPAFLLYSPEVAYVLDALSARVGLRMTGTFGTFRNNTKPQLPTALRRRGSKSTIKPLPESSDVLPALSPADDAGWD
jgi:hypothetical protein